MVVDYLRFLKVADCHSISTAADALHVSQPAMSRTIRLLEEKYTTPLFQRTGSGVELTEAGRTLYLYASRAVRALQSAGEEIGHLAGQQQRTLRICSGDSWGYGVLPEVIRLFSQDMPDVAVHVDLLEHNDRMRGLDNRNYDVALGIVAPEMLATERYSFEPLITAPYDIYCDVRHPLKVRSERPSEQDLLDYRWINHKFEYDFDPSSFARTKRIFARRSNTMLHALEAMRGSEFLLSTAKTMAPIFKRFDLVPLMEDPESPVFQSGIILLAHFEPNRVTRRFLSILHKAVSQRWGSRE